MRWVRKNTRIYEHASCTLCGTAWGGYPDKKCPRVTCLACGSAQCLSNGLGHGSCSICFVGILPGWAGVPKVCGYSGCGKQAVAYASRVGACCKDCMERNGLKSRIEQCLIDRPNSWIQVADMDKREVLWRLSKLKTQP